jgi:hypothetical protein
VTACLGVVGVFVTKESVNSARDEGQGQAQGPLPPRRAAHWAGTTRSNVRHGHSPCTCTRSLCNWVSAPLPTLYICLLPSADERPERASAPISPEMPAQVVQVVSGRREWHCEHTGASRLRGGGSKRPRGCDSGCARRDARGVLTDVGGAVAILPGAVANVVLEAVLVGDEDFGGDVPKPPRGVGDGEGGLGGEVRDGICQPRGGQGPTPEPRMPEPRRSQAQDGQDLGSG